MGFYKEDYEILDFLKQKGYFKHKAEVCEFGSQDLLEDREGNVFPKSENGRWHPASGIYKGEYSVANYECMDLEGAHNALRFDLGLDLRQHYNYTKQFDIVTCKDIGHWIFDQKQLFTNIHNLTKVGGAIIWRSAIGGGFAQGCFAYHHYKILQLAFANNYLFLGGYITEYLHAVTNGKFGNFDRREATPIESLEGDGFIPKVESYMGRPDSWRYLPLSRGLPSISPTLIFIKQDDREFAPPLFFYAPNTEVVKRHSKSVLQNCLPPIKKGKVAIFGAGEAGELAAIFLREAGVEIDCFIDDYKNGEKDGLPIVKSEEFIQNRQENCDFILKGPCQNGEPNSKGDISIPIKSLYYYWFVG